MLSSSVFFSASFKALALWIGSYHTLKDWVVQLLRLAVCCGSSGSKSSETILKFPWLFKMRKSLTLREWASFYCTLLMSVQLSLSNLAFTNILWVICLNWKQAITIYIRYYILYHVFIFLDLCYRLAICPGCTHLPPYSSWMDSSNKQSDYILTLHESLFIKHPSPTILELLYQSEVSFSYSSTCFTASLVY